MSCAACQEQLSQTLDGTDTPDRAALDLHLHGCAACQAYQATVLRLQTGLGLLCPPVPPPGLGARLVAAVREDQRRLRRRAQLRLVVSFAAAACVVVGVTIALWPGRPTPRPTVPDVVKKVDPEPPTPSSATATPRQSVETAVEAMASLTARTTNQTVAETKKLMPLVEPSLAPLTWEPTLPTLSLNGAGHGIREGLEPMEIAHAKPGRRASCAAPGYAARLLR